MAPTGNRRRARAATLSLLALAVPVTAVACGTHRDERADPAPTSPSPSPSATTDGRSHAGLDTGADSGATGTARACALLRERRVPAGPGRDRGAVEALRALGGTAPTELRAPFATLTDAMGALADLPPLELDRALAIIERPEVRAAMEAVGPWLQATCSR